MPQKLQRDAVVAGQILFRIKPRIVREVLPYLRREDAEIAYQKLVEDFVESKLSFEPRNREFSRANLEKLAGLYKTLSSYVVVPADESAKRGRIVRPREDPLFFMGALPRRRLRFGSYLLYRGIISKSMLRESLEWQKRNRPLFGQLAMKNSVITVSDFARILYAVAKGAGSFGSVGLDLGVLSAEEVDEIVDRQRTFACPIGKFYVEKGILTPDQVLILVREMQEHNRDYPFAAANREGRDASSSGS